MPRDSKGRFTSEVAPLGNHSETPPEPLPPRDELVRNAIEFISRHSTLMPVLHGASTWGKTRFAEELAQERGADFTRLLLQHGKPDDIAGAQVIDAQGELNIALAWWFKKARVALREGRKVVLLLDELNLVREELIGAIYTFVRDRDMYGHVLKGDVLVMGACNPGTWDEAFRRRVVWINWEPSIELVNRIAGDDFLAQTAVSVLTPAFEQQRTQQIPPPPPEATPAVIDLLHSGGEELLAMSKPHRDYILGLLMVRPLAEKVMRELESMGALSSALLLRNPAVVRKVIREATIPDVIAIGTSVLLAAADAGRLDLVPTLICHIQMGLAGEVGSTGNEDDCIEKLGAWFGDWPVRDEVLAKAITPAVQTLGEKGFFDVAETLGFLKVGDSWEKTDGEYRVRLMELIKWDEKNSA